MSAMNCASLYRLENLETLSEEQHRHLDNLAYDGTSLIRIAATLPPKKQVNFRVDNLITGIKYKLDRIIPREKRTPMNALWVSYHVFLSYATITLERYTH